MLRKTETRSGEQAIPSEEIRIKLFDMVLCFSRALDLLHPAIADHHLRVAYIACCIAKELGFSEAEIQNVLIAGALHDAGAASSAARLHILEYALNSYQLDGAEISEDIRSDRMKSRSAHASSLLPTFLPRSPKIAHTEWEWIARAQSLSWTRWFSTMQSMVTSLLCCVTTTTNSIASAVCHKISSI